MTLPGQQVGRHVPSTPELCEICWGITSEFPGLREAVRDVLYRYILSACGHGGGPGVRVGMHERCLTLLVEFCRNPVDEDGRPIDAVEPHCPHCGSSISVEDQEALASARQQQTRQFDARFGDVNPYLRAKAGAAALRGLERAENPAGADGDDTSDDDNDVFTSDDDNDDEPQHGQDPDLPRDPDLPGELGPAPEFNRPAEGG